jgi:hypothetical protein
MFKRISILYILIPLILVWCLVMLVIYLRERRRGNLEAWPRLRFKLGGAFYAIVIFVLMLCLPAIWYEDVVNPESGRSSDEVVRFQSLMASDLHRMREVMYYALLITACWVVGLYNNLKAVVPRASKTTDLR